MPGWGSFINSWEIVLKEMTKHFEIFYVETREKGSAKHNPEQPITIQEIGKDLARVIELKGLTKDSFIMFGSSMGATAIIESILNSGKLEDTSEKSLIEVITNLKKNFKS